MAKTEKKPASLKQIKIERQMVELYNSAITLFKSNNLYESQKMLKKAADLGRGKLEPNNETALLTQAFLAVMLMGIGDMDQALSNSQEVLLDSVKYLGLDHKITDLTSMITAVIIMGCEHSFDHQDFFKKNSLNYKKSAEKVRLYHFHYFIRGFSSVRPSITAILNDTGLIRNPEKQIADLYISVNRLLKDYKPEDSTELSKLKNAGELLSEATQLCYRNLSPGNSLTLNTQGYFAMVLMELGNPYLALRNIQESFVSSKQHNGSESDLTIGITRIMFIIMMLGGDFFNNLSFLIDNDIDYRKYLKEINLLHSRILALGFGALTPPSLPSSSIRLILVTGVILLLCICLMYFFFIMLK